MRAIEYFPLSIKKNNQIWLVLQGGIVIPVICMNKMELAPVALT